MDGNGLRNWSIFEPTTVNFKSRLDLQLMSSMAEKPFFGGGLRDHHQTHPSAVMASTNGGPFHHHRVGGISESHFPMDYWMNHSRVLPGNHNHGYYQHNYGVSPETSSAPSIQMPQQVNLPKNETIMHQTEETHEEGDDNTGGSLVGNGKKRGGGKLPKSPPKVKKPRTRVPRAPGDEPNRSVHRARAPKKQAEIMINGINMDISGIPIPVCSCTGNPQQCYRWGSGGWQSACCTTGLSMYPLPMSTKRRGARIAGRKMSIGAFKKVLEKLASEGYDFSNPIDLRNYWAKHGTNKFVTIR